MSSVEYSFRPSFVEGIRLIMVTEAALFSIQGGVTTIIPWEEAVSVRLWFDPTRFDHACYRCRVTSGTDRQIELRSTTFAGVARFESQLPAYRAAVVALHRALAPRGDAVGYQAGQGGVRYAFNVGIMTLSFAGLAGVLVMIGFDVGVLSMVRLALLALLIPLGILWIVKNRPRRYSPTQIPESVLPAPTSEPR